MTEKYVQVNIGQGDLDDEQWGNFIANTTVALRQSVRGESEAEIEQHEGVGWWDKCAEESVHISIVADVDTYALRVKLTELKKIYSQDAIALIVGSDLI